VDSHRFPHRARQRAVAMARVSQKIAYAGK
jgi:hypothetical protein